MIDPNHISVFFDDLETYIKALVIAMRSEHVEDSIRLTELRTDFIINILVGKYRDD